MEEDRAKWALSSQSVSFWLSETAQSCWVDCRRVTQRLMSEPLKLDQRPSRDQRSPHNVHRGDAHVGPRGLSVSTRPTITTTITITSGATLTTEERATHSFDRSTNATTNPSAKNTFAIDDVKIEIRPLSAVEFVSSDFARMEQKKRSHEQWWMPRGDHLVRKG